MAITHEERSEKIYNLTVELTETEAQKRSSNKAFNEEIKRLKAEIKDILDGKVEDKK